PLRGADAAAARERHRARGRAAHPPLPPLLLDPAEAAAARLQPLERAGEPRRGALAMRRLAALVILLATLAALLRPARAAGVDGTSGGSGRFDYHSVPAENGPSPRSIVFDGMTVEVALKLAVDFTDHLSANVKVCVACHGFETDMTYLEYRV